MPDTWTVEQVLSLAPDANSAASGKELANAGKWVSLGCGGASAWGECKGSGKNPYQTQIDLSEPAFKCSCPSRKFPCKHALGLFLLLAKDSSAFAADTPPQWVTDWISSRQKRAEQKTTKAEERAEKAADPEAQVKRAAGREAKVRAGMEELELWLRDLIRGGFAAAQTRPYSFWEQVAARMVDAQAPGVARVIKDMPGLISSGDGWYERLLQRVSRLYLLLESHKRIDTLPEPVQADIRSVIGWTQDQDELLKGEGVNDTWFVAGHYTYEEDRLRVQRTWLLGCKTRKPALILHFTHMSQPAVDVSLVPGTLFDGELVFFPGSYPLRALIKDRRPAQSSLSAPAYPDWQSAVGDYAGALAVNPWVEEFPVMVVDVVPCSAGERWTLRDSSGSILPITPQYKLGWHLLAISGGHPIAVFGEWNGECFSPLSAWCNGALHLVAGNGGGQG